MAQKKLKIAVIGSGVAGLTAAYILNREYDVTVYEKNDYPGGHTHTIVIDRGPDRVTLLRFFRQGEFPMCCINYAAFPIFNGET